MSEKFILQKTIDASVLNRGLSVPAAMKKILAENLSGGALTHGEKRVIKIILEGEIHAATLTSINFNRKNYPNHQDIWQIVYSKNSPLAARIRNIFAAPNEQNYLILYATDFPDTFYFEPIFTGEIQNLGAEQTVENLLEVQNLTDAEAALIEKYRLVKIRKLNRSIGEYLKNLYQFRCQICGQNFSENYGLKIAECHHINYFVNSLNNDAANLLIVCPNHHRIIHAANPIFDAKKKIYRYPNGFEEKLQLNLHL